MFSAIKSVFASLEYPSFGFLTLFDVCFEQNENNPSNLQFERFQLKKFLNVFKGPFRCFGSVSLKKFFWLATFREMFKVEGH